MLRAASRRYYNMCDRSFPDGKVHLLPRHIVKRKQSSTVIVEVGFMRLDVLQLTRNIVRL